MLLDGEILLEEFWPAGVPDDFAKLKIPLIVVATDFHGRCETTSGDLASAVAGSLAIPTLVKPVSRDGLTLIDGGVSNPLPFDHLFGAADIVAALDVIGEPATAKGAVGLFPGDVRRGADHAARHRQPDNRAQAAGYSRTPQIEVFLCARLLPRRGKILAAGDSAKDALKLVFTRRGWRRRRERAGARRAAAAGFRQFRHRRRRVRRHRRVGADRCRDLDLSKAQSGWAMGAYALAYAITSPIIIAATGRIDRRLVIAGGGAVVAACVATALAANAGTLFAARVLAALGAGVVTPGPRRASPSPLQRRTNAARPCRSSFPA